MALNLGQVLNLFRASKIQAGSVASSPDAAVGSAFTGEYGLEVTPTGGVNGSGNPLPTVAINGNSSGALVVNGSTIVGQLTASGAIIPNGGIQEGGLFGDIVRVSGTAWAGTTPTAGNQPVLIKVGTLPTPTTTGGAITVTFPSAFPNALYGIFTKITSGANVWNAQLTSAGTASFTAVVTENGSIVASGTAVSGGFYCAIGA